MNMKDSFISGFAQGMTMHMLMGGLRPKRSRRPKKPTYIRTKPTSRAWRLF